MNEGYGSFPASVPAVIVQGNRNVINGTPKSNLQNNSPVNGGYQAPGTSYDGDAQASTTWRGVFNIASYTPYFDVDADVVVDRIISSVYPMNDFSFKTNGNPDLYGPIWISTTLVVFLAALGNYGTYLLHKSQDSSVAWSLDVNFFNRASCLIYGYTIAVPVAFYLMLQYLGSPANIFRLWCMWGYSLFIFLPACVLLVVPSEIFRWFIIIIVGAASSYFIALNLDANTQDTDLMVLSVSAFVLHFVLALCIQIFFFS